MTRMRGKEEERAGDANKVIAEQAEQVEQLSDRVYICMFHRPRKTDILLTSHFREVPIASGDACLGHGSCSLLTMPGRKHRPWTVVTRESGMEEKRRPEETNSPRHVRDLA